MANDFIAKNGIDIKGSVKLNGLLAVSESGSYLRLNNSNQFTSGTYTPSAFRVDNKFQVGANITDALYISSDYSVMNWKGSQVLTSSSATISTPSLINFTNNTTWSFENGGTNTHGLGIINNSSTANTGAQLNLRANTFDCTIVAIGSGTNTGSLRFYTDISTLAMSIGDSTTSGLVTFNTTPKVNSTFVSLEGHTHSYLPLTGGTVSGSTAFTGGVTLQSNLLFQDNHKLYLGTGSDLQLYHDGSNSSIDNITGNLTIGTTGASSLYFKTNNSFRWSISVTSGHLIPYADSTYDIGTTGNRVANIYADNINSGDATINSYTFSAGSLSQSSYGVWTWNTGYTSLYGKTGNTLKLGANNVQGIWEIQTTGHLSPYADSTYDVGSTSYYIRDVYTNYIKLKATASAGIRFWNGSDAYKISMGNSSEYQYGDVTTYSIKTAMDTGDSGVRGFTWGSTGVTPVASLNAVSGNLTTKGSVKAQSVIITDSSGVAKYQMSYNSTTDSLDTVKL